MKECTYCKKVVEYPHHCKEMASVFQSFRELWPKQIYTVMKQPLLIKRTWNSK